MNTFYVQLLSASLQSFKSVYTFVIPMLLLLFTLIAVTRSSLAFELSLFVLFSLSQIMLLVFYITGVNLLAELRDFH